MSEIDLQYCPLTGLKILDHKVTYELRGSLKVASYKVRYNKQVESLTLCQRLADLLINSKEDLRNLSIEKSIKRPVKGVMPFFLGKLGKNNFEDLFSKVIHWDSDCEYPNTEVHIEIKTIANEVIQNGDYPKSNKEKMNLILETIKAEQKYDGEKIDMVNKFQYWGKLYMENGEQLNGYLTQLQAKKLIEVNDGAVNLSSKGLEYLKDLDK